MAVPEDTDKRKCDALLAFSSWALRTRSACLRIFNTPLENALFDHMLSSSPLGAGFSLSCSWLFFYFVFFCFFEGLLSEPRTPVTTIKISLCLLRCAPCDGYWSLIMNRLFIYSHVKRVLTSRQANILWTPLMHQTTTWLILSRCLCYFQCLFLGRNERVGRLRRAATN